MSETAEPFERGWEYQQAGDYPRAEEIYRARLRHEPRSGRVWLALAQLCDADRRPAEAVACFRQALEVDPANAEGHCLLGNVLLQQGRYPEAEASYRRCLERQPDHVTALGNLGYVLGEQDRLDEARACYEKALQIRADLPEIQHNLGNVLREQGRLDDAVACYDRALRLRPEYAKAYINRGVALVAQARLEQALCDLQHGLELLPDFAEAHISLGAALSVQQRFDEALAHYDRALALKPGNAEAAWNQSLIWLLRGDYERGWPAYEWRWQCKRTTPLPSFAQPRWDCSPLNGKTILLYGEQGLGDTLQLARYAALVKERGARRLILQCQNALIPLLSRTPGIDGLVGWGAPPPEFDVWLPLMSLPALFHTTLATIPAKIPYVFPDAELVVHWRKQLAPVRGLRVGISWQGSPRHAWDRHRSVTLDFFEPLARIEGVHLISLQKNLGAEQLQALGNRFPVLGLGSLLDEASGPFMDTAAILANLDLVVCVDTALAHLAGAMGVPAWLALSHTPDWRWLLDRDDSLWYPTLRLFRQPKLGDWASVFRKMADTLAVVRRPADRPLLMPVDPGELLDKITCLEIQCDHAADPAALQRVRIRLAELVALQRKAIELTPELTKLIEQLRAVNKRLWELNEQSRRYRQRGDFGPEFTRLARAIQEESEGKTELKKAATIDAATG